jgi:hypothetical protein
MRVPPQDDLCLRCGMDTQADDSPYPYQLPHDGSLDTTQFFLCWDCGPSEWQAELIDWEATIPEEDRLLSQRVAASAAAPRSR